ncbi:MAG: flagellar protein FlgN [Magnetococcales bacterium]|nr:flagellar protein FlgN [Magnetococcales bacterium]
MSQEEMDLATEVRRLKEVIEPLIRLFEQLGPLLTQERSALRKRDPEVLEVASEKIRATLEEIYKTDQLRQRLTTRLGARVGLGPGKLSLKHLDEALGGRSGLIPIRERLTKAIGVAEGLNKENQAVFSGVLSATESMLRVLKEGTQGPVSSYNRRGNRQSGSDFHFLSRQL